VLVRGHEKVNSGFRNQWSDEDIRLFTLFSAGGADNDDLPPDSNYREVRPMALTITSRDGETSRPPPGRSTTSATRTRSSTRSSSPPPRSTSPRADPGR
jgi:hypothetical protein